MAMDLPIFGQTQTKPATPTLTLTLAAADQVRELLAKRGTPEHGLRVGVRGGGCSGNSYFMEYCEAPGPDDQIFEAHGVKLVIDQKSLMLLGGTEIDFVTGLMGSGFKFNNPNVRHSCACGESFSS
jgi:iron-sulfur cluster assembly protein